VPRYSARNPKRRHAESFVQNQSKPSPLPPPQASSANVGKRLSQTSSTSSPAVRSLPVPASAAKLFQNGDRPHKANGPVPVLKQLLDPCGGDPPLRRGAGGFAWLDLVPTAAVDSAVAAQLVAGVGIGDADHSFAREMIRVRFSSLTPLTRTARIGLSHAR